MVGFKVFCFTLLCIFFASQIYTPLPDNIEESWKVMALDASAKTCIFTALFLENIGVMRFEEFISMIFMMDYTLPLSDEHITVTDTTFTDIPVRLYLPKRKSETLRRAIIYIHGGGFCFGSFKQRPYDFLNRWTANRLDAVVVAVDYRLAPQHHFPVQLEDGIAAIKFFLQDKILRKYRVDPNRVCISGDSSGGTLTAAITQEMQNHPEIKHKIKIQALLYPALQVIDSQLPSHLENEHGVVLTRDIAIKLVSLYFTKDEALPQAMKKNQHMPLESRHLFKLVNWSTLLPEKYRKDHIYKEPILGRSNYSLPGLTDNRALPLLANDSLLQNLPSTYIITCQHDILRDDGLMYVTRLRNAGVPVTHDHIEDGIHGALSYMTSPFYLHLGLRIRDMYISWLDKNL
ncbi:PREDICTED: arylacetamide deacetylase-like 2-like [Chrysochloris asiatica]|uniref:Arylacetamide deacetylase-like 2-like n=1 Tax=Chrysochloris asiatica TaxID=185453 RepID=A0A9B0TW55_CHRAS|nr:PREDICTED: arylacetamide deacetylase-like 2-like [Chrysochloris asiatica]